MVEKSQRRVALDRQIEARKESILDAAILEFIDNGIDNSRISDIAKRAGVGAVTVYRYFENKPKLVIECAEKLWKSEIKSLSPRLNTPNYKALNGFEKAAHILSVLCSLHEICPVSLRLLEQFDNYVVKEHISGEQLLKYEEGIIDTRKILLKAIYEGQRDSSVRSDIDALQFYATATHALVALSQKLLLRGDVIQNDRDTDAKTQISLLAEMELNYIKGMNEVR